MRAAAIALPFESPKLAAMVVSSMSGQDFAGMLDRAIARGSRAREIELRAEPPPEGTLKMADEPRLRLVSNRPKGSDFETFPRLAVRPRYRPRRLAPWRPKLIEATRSKSRSQNSRFGPMVPRKGKE